MLVLGLLLIVIAAGVLVAMLFGGASGPQASVFDGHLHASALVFFLIGAAALLVFIMGLELVRAGLRRANRNRKNSKRLRRLEKREAARRQEAARRGDAATAGPSAGTDEGRAPAGTSTTSTGTATDTSSDASTDASTAGNPAGTDTATRPSGGPYQTPPPAR